MQFRSLHTHPAFVPALAFVFLAALMLVIPSLFATAPTTPSGSAAKSASQSANTAVAATTLAHAGGTVVKIEKLGPAVIASVHVTTDGPRTIQVNISRGTRIIDARHGGGQFAAATDVAVGQKVFLTGVNDAKIGTGSALSEVRLLGATTPASGSSPAL